MSREREPRHAATVALLVLGATALLCAGCGGHSASSPLRRRLLSVADLPAGWSVAAANPKSAQLSRAPCLSGLGVNAKGWTYSSDGFVEGSAAPVLIEVLATGPKIRSTWQKLDRALAQCRTATMVVAGKKVESTIRSLPFPRIAAASFAYAWAFTFAGVETNFDLVFFDAGTYAGYVAYADVGSPEVSTVEAFARAAAAKAKSGSTARVANTVSIASAPIQTVHTARGTVAYRAIGSGPPLLLITGYSGTMEAWDRRFVDALARRNRVVMFDNAGIGRTQALPAPLGIDAMANQTSALIDALDLGRPNVLGWSMGTMIAQALAVLHPTQVHRLVLCAGYPGNGTATRPPEKAIDALKSGNLNMVMADLFPADQTAAQSGYLAAISSYPAAPAAPAAIVTAQGHAVDDWWAGTDPAGKKTAGIAAPTLIADGAADRLDPTANSHTLAKLIPGAKLQLYPDAGHAFLFQEQKTFVPLIESFLG